jgi:hypothetical protein
MEAHLLHGKIGPQVSHKLKSGPSRKTAPLFATSFSLLQTKTFGKLFPLLLPWRVNGLQLFGQPPIPKQEPLKGFNPDS